MKKIKPIKCEHTGDKYHENYREEFLRPEPGREVKTVYKRIRCSRCGIIVGYTSDSYHYKV